MAGKTVEIEKIIEILKFNHLELRANEIFNFFLMHPKVKILFTLNSTEHVIENFVLSFLSISTFFLSGFYESFGKYCQR